MKSKTFPEIIKKLEEGLSRSEKSLCFNDKDIIKKAITKLSLNSEKETEEKQISEKILYCKIILALYNLEEKKDSEIIKEIVSRAKSIIIDNKSPTEDIKMKDYDDDKKIYLFEKISEYSKNNKLLTFCKIYNMKNNLNELQKEFNGFPDNEDKLSEYYLFLKEKSKNDNLFYKCKIESYKNMESIKTNIRKTLIKSYIQQKKNEMTIKDKEIDDIFEDLLKGSVLIQFKKVKNKEDYPAINKVYNHLKKKFDNIENSYEGKYAYGLSLLNNRLCFYDYGNREIIMNILSNAINIQKVKYDDVFRSESEASISIKDNSSSSLKSEDKIILKNNYLKGINFENNINLLMDKLFTNNNLIDLPGYIFPMQPIKKDFNRDNTLINKMKNMFNYFIELDKGILNISNNDIKSNNLTILPYILDKTILFQKKKFTTVENKVFIIKKNQ